MKDGGPAFPVIGRHVEDGNHYPPVDSFGMSLRDYFAAMAMQGYLSSSGQEVILARRDPDKAATWAYEDADAMLKARQR